MRFYGFWMILYDLATLPNVGEHLVLSKFAISSRLDGPKWRKWTKTSFLAIWIIQKWFFMVFEWSSMWYMVTKLLRTFSIIKVCNIKLIRWPKVQKTAYSWMDHSKQPVRRTKKILKNQQEFFRTCGFHRVLKKRLLYHNIVLSENSLQPFSVKIWPKSKKGHFWHVFVIFEWSGIFLEKTAV